MSTTPKPEPTEFVAPATPPITTSPAKDPEWPKSVEITGRLKFVAPTWKGSPRRVTGSHITALARYLEACTERFFDEIDVEKPYAIDDVHFQARYLWVGADSEA